RRPPPPATRRPGPHRPRAARRPGGGRRTSPPRTPSRPPSPPAPRRPRPRTPRTAAGRHPVSRRPPGTPPGPACPASRRPPAAPRGAGPPERPPGVARGGRRPARLRPPGRRDRGQQSARPGQEPGALLADGRPVQLLLAVPELPAPPVVGVGGEQGADDLGVAHPEGGGEVGPGERPADLARQPGPGPEVRIGSVDERAVDVPDNRGVGHGHTIPGSTRSGTDRGGGLAGEDPDLRQVPVERPLGGVPAPACGTPEPEPRHRVIDPAVVGRIPAVSRGSPAELHGGGRSSDY